MAQSFRAWLKTEPVPHTLLCSYEDAEDKKVKMGSTRSRLRDAESACKNAVRVEALDADGSTLRVWDNPEAPESSHDAEVIATPLPTAADQNMAMVTTIAKLLLEAGNAGAARHAEAYNQVFERYDALMTTISDRLQQFETIYQQMLLAKQEEIAEAAEEVNAAQEQIAASKPETSPNEAMVNTLLQGALMKMSQS